MVEDDPDVGESLLGRLERDRHDIRWVTSGGAVIDAIDDDPPDLVILDLGLPDVDGLDVCRSIRRRWSDLPVLVLTARADEIDVVAGLEAGADDYVTKPFRLAELLARINARTRRHADDHLEAGGLHVDVGARRAALDGADIELTTKEFDLLVALMADMGRVVSRQRLMRDVWDERWTGSTKTLDVHISWLRQKLGDDVSAPRFISTVRGVGFRFEP